MLPLGLVGLELWLVSGLVLNKYRCEFINVNCIFATRSNGENRVILLRTVAK